MNFSIWRDPDNGRMRKVEIELSLGDVVVDTTYMFAFPLFTLARRLERRKRRMMKRAAILLAAEGAG
jgi:hypothetical protein